jgi:hypothetical protein
MWDPLQPSTSLKIEALQQYFFWPLDPSGARNKVGKIFS